MTRKHNAPTPHTSNVEHIHMSRGPSSGPNKFKSSSVLILGPLTQRLTQQQHCLQHMSDEKQMKRVHSAPCLGARSTRIENVTVAPTEVMGTSKVGAWNQVVAICVALAIYYALTTSFRNSYKNIAMGFIPVLIFVLVNNPCRLVTLLASAEAYNVPGNLHENLPEPTELMSSKTALKAFILAGFTLWFVLDNRNKQIRSTLPGIDEYVIGISTLIWATLECIFHASRAKINRLLANVHFGDLVTTTLLKMVGFVFIFLPFVVGLFYFALSPLILTMIPISSLILCVANGLYPPPSFLFLVLTIALFFVSVKVLNWVVVVSYQIYSRLLEMNLKVMLVLMMVLAVAGLCDQEVISDHWLPNLRLVSNV
jgi:hypothetical protein